MIRLFVSVMLLFSFAYGQPVEGPWTISQHDGGLSLSNPQIALHSDSLAEIFYQIGDTLIHGTVVDHSGQVLFGMQTIIDENPAWHHHLCASIWTGTGWVTVVYDSTSQIYRVRALEGEDSILRSTPIDSGRFYDGGLTSSGGSDYGFSLERRPLGGYVVGWRETWVHYNVWPPPGWSEAGYGIVACVVAADWPHNETFGNYFWGCPSDVPVTKTHYVSDDSLLLFESCHGWTQLFFATVNEINGFGIASYRDITCSSRIIESLFSHGDRIFFLSGPTTESTASLIELHDLGTCETLLAFEHSPIASTSHPDFGIAWLSQPSSGLQLTRVDTNGTLSQPEGVLYWPEVDQRITAAKLSISDNGKIVAVWTEQQISNPEHTSLKIASVAWNAPLYENDNQIILHPSSFSLSAFPNPFNSELRIAYDLPRTQDVTLSVSNVLGQTVETIFAGHKSAGSYAQTWKPETGTGVYFVTLRAGQQVKTGKVLYLK